MSRLNDCISRSRQQNGASHQSTQSTQSGTTGGSSTQSNGRNTMDGERLAVQLERGTDRQASEWLKEKQVRLINLLYYLYI